jgi:hypothetical protein
MTDVIDEMVQAIPIDGNWHKISFWVKRTPESLYITDVKTND